MTESTRLSSAEYLTVKMFDSVVRDKFQKNVDDAAVRRQALALVRIVQASASKPQIIADILHASAASRNLSKEGVAQIGFSMGLQFGFELGLTYPPPRPGAEDGDNLS